MWKIPLSLVALVAVAALWVLTSRDADARGKVAVKARVVARGGAAVAAKAVVRRHVVVNHRFAGRNFYGRNFGFNGYNRGFGYGRNFGYGYGGYGANFGYGSSFGYGGAAYGALAAPCYTPPPAAVFAAPCYTPPPAAFSYGHGCTGGFGGGVGFGDGGGGAAAALLGEIRALRSDFARMLNGPPAQEFAPRQAIPAPQADPRP